jgi:hypothetical protein
MAPLSGRMITETKQHWSVIGWVTKNFSSSSVLRHVKPLVPVEFVVVSTHQSALGPRGPRSPCGLSIRKACALAVGTLIG